MPEPTTTFPTSVWNTGRTSTRRQLHSRYVCTTQYDTVITPAIAAQVIASYSAPGDTVCDPDPGAGIVLGEALRSGRHALGIQPRGRWRQVCQANLDLARLGNPACTATLLDDFGDPSAAELPGAVDLVLTAVRHTPFADPTRVVVGVYDTLRAVADWVWPGGHVVVTGRPWRRDGALVDLPGQVCEAADAVGLIPTDHCIALTAPIRDRRVEPRTVGSLHSSRNVHVDILAFRVPTVADTLGGDTE